MHCSGPQALPVPTSGTLLKIDWVFTPAPTIGFVMLEGRLKKAFAKLVVPVSSELSAEMS